MSEPALTDAGFPAFFRAVWSVDPFPWQADLLTRLATGEDARRAFAGAPGRWPAVLDLPTGSGKTAALDIALFHLALEAGKGEARRAPVRIAFVVNRRLIVDDAHGRAEALADALGWSLLSDKDAAVVAAMLAVKEEQRHLVERLQRVRAEPIVKRVASRLCDLAGPKQPPLVARRLRGGAPREDDWARTPVQPTILCSTVDQVGSRLLFRGYGVSDTMKPIHAGLLGSDCLILLDEAHLSEPFRQTLEAVERLRGSDTARAPFGFAVLTATPKRGEAASDPAPPAFALSPADEAHPLLARRLAASKPARLTEIANKQGVDAGARRADAAAQEAKAIIERLQAAGVAQPAIGVVLNRVARARAVFERLGEELGETATVTLLIGPARAVDREDRAQELQPIRTRHPDAPRPLARPLIVVATQTIEAGVDIDFDGLVTEVAALDALRQRFGRLNRAGRSVGTKALKEGRPDGAQAVILAHKGDLATDDDVGAKADPVYGGRIKRTWAKLQQIAAGSDNIVDFGIRKLRERITREEAADLSTPTPNAPVLMPAYAHLWSQTAPIPNADPDVALFLHGPDRASASVQIVWRADLDEARDLKPAMGKGQDADTANAARQRLIELLKLVPPRAAEAVEVPLWAARAWLERADAAGKAEADFSDAVEPDKDTAEPGRATRRAFRWAGEDSSRTGVVYPRGLRNGDLIVVPAAYGGCDRWGWHPGPDVSRDDGGPPPVTDVAEEAAWPYRFRRLAVRVTPELIAQEMGPSDEQRALVARLQETLADHAEDRTPRLLDALLALELPPELKCKLERLKADRRGSLERTFAYGGADELGRAVVFLAPRGLRKEREADEVAVTPSTESEALGAASSEPLGLAAHCGHVAAWAEAFVARAGLAAPLAEDIALAAFLHDLGKADRRYQAYYAGGNPYGPDVDEPLAKSGQRRLPEGAWERTGLPDHWRHEALSVRLAAARADLRRAHDRRLVLWLIGTHHGYGRPLYRHEDRRRPEHMTVPLPPALGGEQALDDKVPGPQSLAFDFDGHDWPQLFEALKEKYGIWGLARLEAFVRLADHRASEASAPPAAAQDWNEAAE
jgi:CRISPR-associated endonuclease/helicase Cas3